MMFTGIIEAVGTVSAVRELSGAREFEISAPEISGELKPGDSITVDGACQTAIRNDAEMFAIETIGTTLSRTVAGEYRVGSQVNLERSMVLGGRLDGHLVQGHVDGVGRLLSVRQEGDFWLMDFQIPELVAEVTILHGSITINGVSLTVNALPGELQCQVGIIPFTWEHTNLGSLKPGDGVNFEGDLVGKYVAKLLTAWKGGNRQKLEGLEAWGYGGDKE
jgi:riboflavin synthase